MSVFARQCLLNVFNPALQVKRFRGKINIQKPRPPHFERAKYIALAQPIFKRKENVVRVCDKYTNKWNKDEEENPYQRIIANELLEKFKASRLIAFFHSNPITGEQRFKAFAMFHKQNMFMKQYGRKTLEMAVAGTPYEAVMQFYVSHNMLVFSPEVKIKELLTINRKTPQLILLAGIVEGKFLNRDELQKYSLIPDLQTAQAQFVQTLNSIGGHIVSQLTTHQNTLVSQLQERMKQLEENK